MIRFAKWTAWGLLIAVTGCASSPQMLASQKQRDAMQLVYRTESDRLNVKAAPIAASPTGAVPASFVAQQASTSTLPPVTVGTLSIQYPHPQGIPDTALATAAFRPAGESGALLERSFASRFGLDSGGDEQRPPVVAAWALDIPRWQADAIVGKLQSANFFQRSKTLDAEAYVAVRLDENGFGKNYLAVPELDALLLRVRQQGRPLMGPDATSQVLRLPPGP